MRRTPEVKAVFALIEEIETTRATTGKLKGSTSCRLILSVSATTLMR